MKKNFYCILIICASIILGFSGSVWAVPAPGSLTLSTKDVNINAFFSGQKLTISGQISAGEDVVVEITGHDVQSTFDLKGRVGPFWMTKGNVVFENVPELYLLLLPGNQNIEQDLQKNKLGLKHLEERARTSGSVNLPADIFNMFALLKEKEHLYNKVLGAVKYTDQNDGTKLFTAECRLPALIVTGSYKVIATTIEHGIVKNQIKDSFTVKQVGFVKLVDHLASDRRIIYGVSAVIIALVAGLAMGVIFKQSGDAH